MDIENLVKLAKQGAKPWAIVSYVLAALLGLSVGGNIYQAIQQQEIIIENETNFTHSNYNGNSINNQR